MDKDVHDRIPASSVCGVISRGQMVRRTCTLEFGHTTDHQDASGNLWANPCMCLATDPDHPKPVWRPCPPGLCELPNHHHWKET